MLLLLLFSGSFWSDLFWKSSLFMEFLNFYQCIWLKVDHGNCSFWKKLRGNTFPLFRLLFKCGHFSYLLLLWKLFIPWKPIAYFLVSDFWFESFWGHWQYFLAWCKRTPFNWNFLNFGFFLWYGVLFRWIIKLRG